MAGFDWFRWHHGTVTDPKFALVARKAGASLPDVLAVWAFLLEKASAANVRGVFGEIDCEAVDCLFDFPGTETRTADILAALDARKLTKDGALVAWNIRQPKREREDDTAAERKRKQRAKSQPVTPSHATSRQDTPREEEKREEQDSPPEINGHTGLPAAVSVREGVFEGHDVPRETPNPVAAFAVVLHRAGYRDATSMNPGLVAYVQAGGTLEHLAECAAHPDCTGKACGYPIKIARRELAEKAAPVSTGPPRTQQLGKTAQAGQTLERIKNGLADAGNCNGISETALPRLGSSAGG